MAKAIFVKKARKDNSVVKAGESYYWWAFRYGGKYYSKTRPRASQLTQSEFLSQIYEICEEIEDLDTEEIKTIENLQDIRDDLSSRLNDLASEQYDNQSNMPEGLQYGPTGELLESRAEACEEMANNLDDIDIMEGHSDSVVEDLISEMQNIMYEGE
jgi:hypothetical protein